MDAEIVTLINSGATTLLGLMVTDAWGRTKRAAAELFGGGAGADTGVAADLEETRAQLRKARESNDSAAEADLAAEWRSRLRRAVESDDSTAEALRRFVLENESILKENANRSESITMHAHAQDGGRVYQQGQGTQNNW